MAPTHPHIHIFVTVHIKEGIQLTFVRMVNSRKRNTVFLMAIVTPAYVPMKICPLPPLRIHTLSSGRA